jgi:hypothetical protein
VEIGEGLVKVDLGSKHRFTLSDVVGTTGAAPAKALTDVGIQHVGLPRFKYWSPADRTRKAKTYNFGDGGNLENLGIMALLARKVGRIVLFVNTDHELVIGNYWRVADSLRPLFGLTPGFTVNCVFEMGFEDLMHGLWTKLSSRGPAWHRARYRVLQNALHGIEGGWDVDITWVYNQMAWDWVDRLSEKVRGLLSDSEFANFPHFRTFGQNKRLIDLSARQASLLAHMSCWNCAQVLKAIEAGE